MIRGVVIVLAASLVLAACGSSGSNSTPTSTAAAIPTVPTTTPQVERARIAAAQCFRAHGINIPDFTAGGGRIRAVLQTIASYPANEVQSVTQACMPSLRQAFPNALGTDLTPAERSERRQQALAFAECMRARGITNYPDPTTAGANPTAALNALNSLDTSSPAFQSASQKCRPKALGAGAVELIVSVESVI